MLLGKVAGTDRTLGVGIMSVGKAVAICATSSLTMFNVFLLVMLVWSAQVTRAQTFEKQLKASLTGQQELTSASAAVIQGT